MEKRGDSTMYYILASLERLYEAMLNWHWACVIAIFVFCAIVKKTKHFFAFAIVIVFAWLMRDLTNRVELDPSYQWAFTGVLLAGVAYAIYIVFHGVKRSGW
jgi:hypothetical protein